MFVSSSWLIFAILAGIASNGFNFLSRYFMKDNDNSTVFAWYVEFARSVIFGIIAIFDWHLVVSSQSITILLLVGLTETIAIYFFMKMHTYSQLSISTIISRTRMIWVPIFAFVIIGERLHLIDYIGIAILFFGVSIVSAPNKLLIDKGARYANVAAILIALNIVIAKLAVPYASNSVILFAWGLPSIIIFPLLIRNAQSKILISLQKNFKLKSFSVLVNVLSMYLFMFALRLGDSGKVTAIYQGMLVFSVLAGIFLLKEKDHIAKKLIGATIAIVGVVLLSNS